MARKIDPATEQEILEELKSEVSYSKISEKYGIGKGTISRIKNRKDKNLEVNKPNPKTISHRRKLKEKAIERNIVKHSELIVFEMIDVLAGLKYCVNNLVDINEDAKIKVDEIAEKLEKLIENVRKYINDVNVTKNGTDIGKEELINQIYKTLGIINGYYSKQKIRIEAINALKEQMKMFLDYEISAKALIGIKELLNGIFKGINILPDNEYKLVRDRIIELNPDARELFARFEEALDGSNEHNNQQKQ